MGGTTMQTVFGIGNPLIDVVFHAQDDDLANLSLDKGIMHLVDRARQEEILAYFSGTEPILRPGGSAPNTLLAVAGLGVPAVICGKIGNDEFGRAYTRQVEAYGITSRLIMGHGPTGSSIILVTPDGERTMNTHLGMCQEFGVGDLDEELLKTAGFLYFTGYMWDTEVQKAAIRRAISVARDAGTAVVFDVADPFAVERYRSDFLALLREDVDIVFANRKEAHILFGTSDPAELVDALGEHVRIAALKTGKEGAVVIENTGGSLRTSTVPGRPVNVLDTTGAGDMFAAGFLAALAGGADAVHAGRMAVYLAEVIIQQVGAQLSVEKIRELRNSREISFP